MNIPPGYYTDPDLLATLKAVGFPPGSWVWQVNPQFNDQNNEGRGWVVHWNQKHFATNWYVSERSHLVVSAPGSSALQWMDHTNVAGWKP